MNFEVYLIQIGRFWGRHAGSRWVNYLRRRATQFELTIIGEEYLKALGDQSFLLVSNHVFPKSSELWPIAHIRFLSQYHQSADSFIFYRIVWEQTGRVLKTAALSYPGGWSSNPIRRWLQQHIAQPLTLGQMQGIPNMIPTQRNPGSYQRQFLEAVIKALQERAPIVIFPAVPRSEDAHTVTNLGIGAAHLARKYHLMVLPASIAGSESWQPGNRVTVAFGEAFSPEGMTKNEINQEMRRRIEALMTVAASSHSQRSIADVASV